MESLFHFNADTLFFLQGLIIAILLLVFFIPPFFELKVYEFLVGAFDFFLRKYKRLF